jgi:hypothetical protein
MPNDETIAHIQAVNIATVPWQTADEYVMPLRLTRNESEPWADIPKDVNGNFLPQLWPTTLPPAPKKTLQDQAGQAIDDALKRELEKRVSPESKTPLPLTYYVKRKSEFPVDALCGPLRYATNGIVDIIQCPKALAAMSVLSAASLAVQGHADVVSPATGQAKPTSLYLLSIAESGERKTSADTEALKPATAWEKQLEAIYAHEFPGYKNRFDAWDSERTHILRNKSLTPEKRVYALAALGPQPQAPLNPMLTCSEPTIEGLYSLFLKGQPSLGLFSSEGGQFIGGHGMNDDARIRTGGALCSLWDGETVKRVRAAKDETYSLSGRRLAMHLMVQPVIAEQFLSMKDLEGQGLFSRILVSYPDSTIGTRKQHSKDPLTDQSMFWYCNQLFQVFQKPLPLAPIKLNELCPRGITFDVDAVALWMDYADSIEVLQVAGGVYENIRGFAGKMAENASRIAGVMTLVENIEATTISKDSLNNAITIMNYFGEQALAMFESSRVGPDMLNAEKLLNWPIKSMDRKLHQRPHCQPLRDSLQVFQ